MFLIRNIQSLARSRFSDRDCQSNNIGRPAKITESYRYKRERTMPVAHIFQNLKDHFNADAAAGLNLVFQFAVEDADNYHLIVKDGNCDMVVGDHDDPSVTLIMSTETLQGIVSGETNGMQAFMAGQLRAEGDMMLAMKLGELFNIG